MPSISQRTIAKELGISQATVSLVVNDPQTPLIAEPTRNRIIKFCRDHGYKIGNRRKATDYIGVLMDVEYLSGRTQIHHLLGGIHRAARSMGKSVIFEQPDIDPENLIRKAPFEGLIVTEPISDEKIDQLRNFVPIVFVNHFFNLNHSDCVVSDNDGGTFLATEALAKHGHQKVLCFGNDHSVEPRFDMRSKRRLSGYKDACESYGLKSEVFTKPFSEYDAKPEVYREIAQNFLVEKGVTGVVAMHDFQGVKFMRAAEELGLRAPDDYSIIGFGDGEQCQYSMPKMASIGEEFVEMGAAALEMLTHRISDEVQRPPRKIVCGTHLVERPSLGPVPKVKAKK